MESDEPALVARARQGDVASFEALVDRHYVGCLRYAIRMLGNRADAEDVVQETFVRAYRSLDRYDERARFRGWLLRILVNRCRTLASKRARREPLLLAFEHLRRTSGRVDVFGIVDSVAERSELEAALERLPVDHREAFLLRYLEELSYAEMSALTGIGESALKMRVKRARERLRAMIDAS